MGKTIKKCCSGGSTTKKACGGDVVAQRKAPVAAPGAMTSRNSNSFGARRPMEAGSVNVRPRVSVPATSLRPMKKGGKAKRGC